MLNLNLMTAKRMCIKFTHPFIFSYTLVSKLFGEYKPLMFET